MKRMLRKIKAKATDFNNEIQKKRIDKLVSNYNINGYKRIYHIHNRKSGGTSINHMFLSLFDDNTRGSYSKLNTPPFRIIVKDRVFTGWDPALINEGRYFYAFSHVPFHKLDLPENTFTFTCFRDPVKRIVSLYRMLYNYKDRDKKPPGQEEQQKWMGNDFGDFIVNISEEERQAQLYMFSENFDVEEAYQNVLKCSHFFFTENFNDGIKELNQKLNLNLEPVHTHKFNIDVEIKDEHIKKLRSMLKDEYALLEKLRNHKEKTA